jgi:GNAT superfamily N-acetyltransferase
VSQWSDGPVSGWRVREYVGGWVDGWTRSRQTPRPEPFDGGWYVETRTEREHGRYVLDEPTKERLAAILEEDLPPTTAIKFPGDPEEWLPLFGEGWAPDHDGWFMTRRLGQPPGRQAPPGYEVRVEAAPTLVVAEVLAPEGDVAASGRMGLGTSYAVADQIVTDDKHRRLGLGTVVMAALERRALDAGLERAVLGATVDGRALYERLGWDVGAPLTAVYRTG